MSDRPANSPDRSSPNGVEVWLDSHIKHCENLINEESVEHNEETVRVKEWLFWIIIILSLVALPALLVAAWTWIPPIVQIVDIPINPQFLIPLPLLAYILAGFHKVGTDEVAGADFFGLPVHQFRRGLKWIPFLILNFNKEKSTFVQSEFPGDADHIQWSDEKEVLLPGKVRPIYVLSGENLDGPLPTDKQMNLGISILSKFQLVHERFFDLIANVGPVNEVHRIEIRNTMTGGENVSDIMLEVVRHLRDTSTAIMGEIAGQLSYNEITAHLHLVNKLLHKRLEKTVITWGVKITECRVTKINPGHEFNKEIQLRANAMAQRDNTITIAEGEKQQLIMKGEGNAAAEQAMLEARAKGYAAVAKVARTKSGQIAISADVGGKLAESDNNTVVVGTDGLKDLMGMVVAAKKVG